MEWIKCSERMPTTEEEFLVIDSDKSIYMALYKEWNAPCGFGFESIQVEDRVKGSSDRIQLKNIVYWMDTESIFNKLIPTLEDGSYDQDCWDKLKTFTYDCVDDNCSHDCYQSIHGK